MDMIDSFAVQQGHVNSLVKDNSAVNAGNEALAGQQPLC